MEQMIANGIQLIKTNASYVFDSDTVFYRNEIPFANQSNDFDITDCFYAQTIDFTDLSVLQFLSVESSVTCVVKNYLGVTLSTINGVNVGTYDTQNVFNITINWSAITGNLERCYLQITDGTEYFKSEPLKMINLKQRIKIRYRMLRNHKSVGYFFNPDDEFYEFFHIFYIEAAITEFKREIVKSVFEDSNQNLLNLFGTFRHSFLLKTFQVAYYMHEKVVTLSLCDEIYLSEIKAGNEYEGRIFLSKDETPAEEIIESTNLYVSSTRYVVDRAFRLVGAAQETPIIPDFDFGIVPIHHTNPNGKKSTFKTPYALPATAKTLYTPQGNPTDYLFKIGGTTDNFRNGHDAAWTGIASKTFAEFSLLAVPVDSHVLVTYIGSLTQTDIVATLYAPIADTPLNPSTRTLKPNTKTANNDFLIYPKLVTGFDSVGISTGAATLFSQQRTFSELANSSDLTNFNNGIVNLPITTETGIGHLFLQRTNTTALTVNITTNQADPKKEIIAYCIPNNSEFYPTTNNGTNPISIKGDGVNDRFIVADSPTGARLFTLSGMVVGEERSYTWLASAGNFGVFPNSNSADVLWNNQGFNLGGFNYNELGGGGSVQIRFENTLQSTLPNYITFRVRRKALIGTSTTVFDMEMFINGRKLSVLSTAGSISRSDDPFAALGYNFGMRFGDNIAVSNIRFWQLNKRWITEEEIRRIHLGDESIPAEYKYLFNNIVMTNQIPAIGTLPHDNIVMTNHANTTTNLFL